MSFFMCKKCGHQDYYLKQRGFQVGLYCSQCGSWQKWISKKELLSYKSESHPLYSESATVPLKNNLEMGIDSAMDVPFDIDVNSVSVAGSNVSNNSNVSNSSNVFNSYDLSKIEQEIEHRVLERLEKGKELNSVSPTSLPISSKNSSYCPCCEGIPLRSEGDSRVEVTVFGGVMTVTDIDGLNIYGIYKLNNCPFCGKQFN